MVILLYFSSAFINIFVFFPYIVKDWIMFMVFNVTFNTISAISWMHFFVQETRENHQSVASH